MRSPLRRRLIQIGVAFIFLLTLRYFFGHGSQPHAAHLEGAVSEPFADKKHARPSQVEHAEDESEARAHEVRDAFRYGWKGYKQYAFPHDLLLPLSNKFQDDRCV